MKGISNRELELPDAMIGKLQKIATESKDVISLSIGEPDFLTPKPLLTYAKKIIKQSTHYTPAEGYSELREVVSRKLKKENRIKTNVGNIIITSGSQAGLFSALLSTLDPKCEVILPNPSYLGYLPAVELVSAIPKFVKLEEKNNFEINPDDVKKVANKKTKVLIINSPSNPTGNVIRKKILEELADIAIEKDFYIFSDEAYEKLIYDKKHISIGSLNGMQNHVVTFQTFSKSFAMCGFRLGYIAGPEKLTSAISKVSHYTNICAPAMSQRMGIEALKLPNKYLNKMLKEYNRRRLYIVKRLNEMNLRTCLPEGAFYAFSKIPQKNSVNFARKLLREAKVATVPGTEFGKYGEGYIRFSYATKLLLIEKAMERIEKVI